VSNFHLLGTQVDDLPRLVLVAVREKKARESIGSFLEAKGLDVHSCSNGIEAINAIQTAVPGVIVMDLTLRKLDSADFLKVLKKKFGDSEIPVIVIGEEDSPEVSRRLVPFKNVLLALGQLNLEKIYAEVERAIEGHKIDPLSFDQAQALLVKLKTLSNNSFQFLPEEYQNKADDHDLYVEIVSDEKYFFLTPKDVPIKELSGFNERAIRHHLIILHRGRSWEVLWPTPSQD